MAQFRAFSPSVEVNGETVLAVVKGLGAFKERAMKLLAENGIPDIKPGGWYNQQSWLNVFKVVAEKLGPATLYMIGKEIPESANFPPGIDSIEKGLSLIDIAYHMNHRGGEIGEYKFVKIGDKKAKMICANPYPCDFDRGLIEAVARKFKTKEILSVNIKHDDTQPCRKKGHDSCSYNIDW